MVVPICFQSSSTSLHSYKQFHLFLILANTWNFLSSYSQIWSIRSISLRFCIPLMTKEVEGFSTCLMDTLMSPSSSVLVYTVGQHPISKPFPIPKIIKIFFQCKILEALWIYVPSWVAYNLLGMHFCEWCEELVKITFFSKWISSGYSTIYFKDDCSKHTALQLLSLSWIRWCCMYYWSIPDLSILFHFKNCLCSNTTLLLITVALS